MQKKRIIIALFFCFVCIWANAQVLTGYVKTRGRVGENGVVISGKRVPSVMIQLEGANPVLTKDDGSFSIPMIRYKNGDVFRIHKVKKSGYELIDKDFYNKLYVYNSKTPLVIVLDTISNIIEDRLEVEMRLRRTLQRKLQERECELEKQMMQSLITNEEYRNKLQALYSQQDNNEKLIRQMVENYSQYDYDQMNERNRKISAFILAGEFEKADSLLREENIVQRMEELTNRRSRIDSLNLKHETEIKKLTTKLASDCYNRAELFRMKMDYDSVSYYLGMRSELDTTNVRWNLDAGNFIVENVLTHENESIAYNFIRRALINSKSADDTQKTDRAFSYFSMGNLYYEQGNFRQAQDNYNLALDNFSEDDEGYAKCIERVAVVYNSMKRYSEAERFHKLAIELYSKRFGQIHNTVAYCYNNIGAVYENLKDYQNSVECYSKAIYIWKQIYGENCSSSSLAVCYNNLGGVYDRMKDYDKAIEYYQKSLETYKESGINPERNISIACVYNNLGSTYYNMSDNVNALTYYGKALKIMRFTRDANHPDVRTVQENIAVVVGEMSQ